MHDRYVIMCKNIRAFMEIAYARSIREANFSPIFAVNGSRGAHKKNMHQAYLRALVSALLPKGAKNSFAFTQSGQYSPIIVALHRANVVLKIQQSVGHSLPFYIFYTIGGDIKVASNVIRINRTYFIGFTMTVIVTENLSKDGSVARSYKDINRAHFR